MNEWQLELQRDKIGPSIDLEVSKLLEEEYIHDCQRRKSEPERTSSKMELKKSSSTKEFEKRISFRNLESWS